MVSTGMPHVVGLAVLSLVAMLLLCTAHTAEAQSQPADELWTGTVSYDIQLDVFNARLDRQGQAQFLGNLGDYQRLRRTELVHSPSRTAP